MPLKTFKRIEKKYVINEEQFKELSKRLEKYMIYDAYCQNGNTYLVQNIYFDTDNNTLISKSIAQPDHKIKIRVRHYTGSKSYFLEWKQKTASIVSKRRISLSEAELNRFIKNGELPKKESYLDKQIVKEFEYFLSLHKLEPKLYLTYQRIAMFYKEDSELRITLDNRIFGSRTNFTWDNEHPDITILNDGRYVLEIKYNQNYPLWLVRILNDLKIFHKSFSKYGEEYKKHIIQGGTKNECNGTTI